PDAEDLKTARAFGEAVAKKLQSAAAIPALAPGTIPGGRPYRPFSAGGAPFGASADESCTGCGLCAKACPAHAISPADARKTDPSLCIHCRACAKVCPVGAIDLREPALWKMVEGLVAANKAGRKEALLVL
ncbi:MAG: 4Fe-4S binding protein, partial [Christensenellaceae bacterium]|nr:4Fe-4S binding protein [Christensenellaceae bacterium]